MCYIRRSDRGGALRGLRLIGGHTDDTWQAGSSVDPSLISESVAESARWIRDRLGANNNSRSLSVLCLDPDGAVCSWVKPEDADPSLLDAAITGSIDIQDEDALEPAPHSGMSERFPQLPMELSFELLDPDETSTGSRAAVMASPDIPGRLLKDELDSIGIRVDCFTSIWHAIANVWDPGSGNPSHSAQRIVSSDSPIAAVIAIDNEDGRLIWTWSREGRLITAGSSRIQLVRGEHDNLAIVRSDDIARICSDWLGWSSQLGVSPSRIVFIGKPSQIESNPENEQAGQSQRGMSPAQIGAAVSKAWPDATIDLIENNDPIGETLSKIATGQRGQGLVSMSGLHDRPTRAHRSMYRWAGMALVAVAAGIGILSYQLFSQAGEINNQTTQIKNDRMELINGYDPALVISQIPQNDLRARLTQMRGQQGPLDVAQSKPILEELETISYVFGIPGIEVDSISLNNNTVTVKLRVEDIAQAEQINQSLSAIKGSFLRWRSMNPNQRGEKVEATFTARWEDGEDGT